MPGEVAEVVELLRRVRPREVVAREPDELSRLGAEIFFQATGATDWITAHRTPVEGVLDVVSTAEGLNIPVDYAEDPDMRELARTEGIIDDKPLKIVIRASGDEPLMSFGHEVGHLFLEFVAGIKHDGQYRSDVERFCDLFGYNFVLPLVEIQSLDCVDEDVLLQLCEDRGMTINDVIFQCIRSGKLPRRVYVESLIGLGTEKGSHLTRDIACMPCKENFGSCEGLPKPEATLYFPDKQFGGFIDICDSWDNYKSVDTTIGDNWGEL